MEAKSLTFQLRITISYHFVNFLAIFCGRLKLLMLGALWEVDIASMVPSLQVSQNSWMPRSLNFEQRLEFNEGDIGVAGKTDGT